MAGNQKKNDEAFSSDGLAKPLVKDLLTDKDLYPEPEIDYSEKIQGKTLEIYHFLASSPGKLHGVSELQKELGYSTPSLVAYHLSRLYTFSLVEKTANGKYFVQDSNPALLGELADHILVADRNVPKIFLYMIYVILTMIAGFILYINDVSGFTWLIFTFAFNLVLLIGLLLDLRYVVSKILSK